MKQRNWFSERSRFQSLDGHGKVDQASIGSDVKHAESAGNADTLSLGGKDPPAVIHKQQIGRKRSGQSNGGGFPFVKSGNRRRFRSVNNLEPGGGIGNPALNRQGSQLICQLRLNDCGKDNRFTEPRKKVDMLDQDQVVDGTGIGNDQLHELKTEAFESSAFLLKIFHGVVFVNTVGLEKSIELNTGEPQNPA